MVRTLLCGNGASARSIIAVHSAQSVRYVIDGPDGAGEPPTILGPDAPELQGGFLRGKAWGPEAFDDENSLWVNAWNSEICWYHFNLQFVQRKWRLVEFGGGCD